MSYYGWNQSVKLCGDLLQLLQVIWPIKMVSKWIRKTRISNYDRVILVKRSDDLHRVLFAFPDLQDLQSLLDLNEL